MSFVSAGSLVTKTPLNISQGTSYFPHLPPMATHGWPSAYAGIYRQQLWVYVVVNKLARAGARLPFPVYQRNELDRPRVDQHPMARLLAEPSPGLSAFQLIQWTFSTWDIYGDTFWLKRRDNSGTVVALVPLHPAAMNFDNGSWSFDNGKLRLDDIADADLVRFAHFDPDSLHRGMSPLEPLRSTLENEWSARTATSSFWRRGARPAMALSHPGNLSEGAATRLKTQFDSIAAGADKTGVTVVLEEGMEPKSMTLTAEEAQYIETRKLNREEVCAAYDVPPPVVHILDRATFSNITEQMRSMYRDTMAPRLKAFEAAIELNLRRAEWPEDNIYAEFLMDEVLRGDFETRQDALAKASHMTIAEKRKVENLPFIEGTDRIFLNTATLPLDAIDAQTALNVSEAPATTPVADDRPLAEVIPLPTARSVLGRLSWQKATADVDAEALAEGLERRDAAAVSHALDAVLRDGGSVADLRRRLSSMGSPLARVKAPDLERHQDQIATALRSYFARQRDAGSSGSREDWDTELAGDLHAVAVAVSRAVGSSAVRDLGFDADVYDVEATVAFLLAVAERLAKNINDTTARQVADAEDPAVVYEQAITSRAAGIAGGAAALIAGFSVIEAGRRVAEAQGVTPRKRWITGPNARPEHAALDGETVDIEEPFSNGQMWPGESGDVDQVAGCNCSVEIEV